MKNKNGLFALAALGLVGGLTSVSSAQSVINITGATLLQNLINAEAVTNDFIDVDGDGVITGAGLRDQLATFTFPNLGCPDADSNFDCILNSAGADNRVSRWWNVQYWAVGSVRGFQNLVNFGRPVTLTSADCVDFCSNTATNARHNRTTFINNQVGTGNYNANNPGGAPSVSIDATTFNYGATTTLGDFQVDIAPVDVPSFWVTQKVGGTAVATKNPSDLGYGTNPKVSVDNPLTPGIEQGFGNTLAQLGSRQLFNGTNGASADTVFDTQVAWAVIAAVTNLGTGRQTITDTELAHLNLSGRLPSGENLTFTNRDIGSGTRNAFVNSVCIDPSFGYGENLGLLSSGNENLLGDEYNPSNKNGNPDVETTVINTRLGVGYAGAERGINSPSWLSQGRLEILGIRFTQQGGTEFSRPFIDEVLDNTANGYRIGGAAIFATLGDPRAESLANGGSNNGNAKMANTEAAKYINNITRSIDAVNAAPGGSATLFTPGAFIAANFVPVAALDFLPSFTDPCSYNANDGTNGTPGLNTFLQGFVRTSNVLANPAYATFGTVTLNGRVPTRKTNVIYKDGLTANYAQFDGDALAYGANLNDRNRVAGDFNGDAARNGGDIAEMIGAWTFQYEGNNFWTPLAGNSTLNNDSGSNIAIHIIGDFNGTGDFDSEDVRYFADVDDSYCNNFFGTELAPGIEAYGNFYNKGDSRADIAGSGVATPGFAPTGSDGVIDADDIDYVNRQFKQNADVTDGALNWANPAEAQNGDLSADINGDLIIDQADVDAIVLGILCTNYGDRNLDGLVDASDLPTVSLGTPGGWAQGDMDGDGIITAADVSIINDGIANGLSSSCFCPADFDGSGFVDTDDFDAFVSDFERGCVFADFDDSGFVDTDDFDAFVTQFELGC
jgi:hypothetical protein